MPQQKFKRRNYFIAPKFQGAHMASFAVFALITGAVIFAVALYLFLYEFGPHRVSQQVISRRILYDFLWIIAAVAAVGLFRALFTSHRVAGPVFRFRRSCKDMAGGNLSLRIYLRKKDKMKDLMDDMNAALDSMCGFITKDREKGAEIGAICEELGKQSDRGPELDGRLARITELAREIGQAFTLPSDLEKGKAE